MKEVQYLLDFPVAGNSVIFLKFTTIICLSHIFIKHKSVSHSVFAWLHLQICLVPLPSSTCTRASHKIWLLNIYSTKILIITNTVNTLFSEEILSVFDEDVSMASRAPIKKRILAQLASE